MNGYIGFSSQYKIKNIPTAMPKKPVVKAIKKISINSTALLNQVYYQA
jgi:hypothetical protein